MRNKKSNEIKDQQKNRILIVDDEKNLLESLSFTLKRNDYQNVTCSNGLTALTLIKDGAKNNAPFDLIITDILLPGLNGLGLIDAVRQQSIKTPVIVISNYGDLDLITELSKKEISAFINKPFSTRKLLNVMSKILKEKSNTH